jgi:hypothetical protein
MLRHLNAASQGTRSSNLSDRPHNKTRASNAGQWNKVHLLVTPTPSIGDTNSLLARWLNAGGFSLLVYDADRKRVIEPDLAKLFAQKYGKKECAFDIQDVRGFDSRNRVLFSADDVIDPGDEEPVPETRCVGGPTEWALDIDSNQLELVKHLAPSESQ